MRAVTNRSGTPQWDAHGRLVPPGGILTLEVPEPMVASPDAEMSEPAAPPSPPEDQAAQKARHSASNDSRPGKPGPK